MKRLLLLVMIAVCLGAADEPKDPLARAREHAQHAEGRGAAKAYVELVRALVDDAGAQYNQQHYDESAKELDEAMEALTKARASAEQHKHDIKQCDLILDKVDRRLRDYSHSFAVQDRPKVVTLEKQVGDVREKLLQILFETR